MKPKISVVTPNFNHGHLLPDMLETTLSQSYPAHEIILIDDASTDNSVEIIENYAQKNPSIRLIKNPKNLGVPASVNKGIHAATGDYIVFRSADDVSYPGFFEEAIRMFQQYPQAGIFCGDAAFFTDDYNNYATEPHGWSKEPTFYTPFQFAQTLKGGFIYGSTCMVKNTAVHDAGCYIEDLKWSTDWFLMLVAAFRHGLCYSPKLVSGNRVDPNGYASAGMADWEKQKKVVDTMLSCLRQEYRDILPYFMMSGCMNIFGPHMAEAVMMNPDHWNAETLMLVLRPLWQWNMNIDQARTASLPTLIETSLRKHYKDLRQLSEAPNKTIAIYGAGTHTKHLLKAWTKMGLRNVNLILESNEPKEKDFFGIPTQSIKNTPPKSIDLVILSSLSFEKEMSQMCTNHLPQTNRIAIWDKQLSSPNFIQNA